MWLTTTVIVLLCQLALARFTNFDKIGVHYNSTDKQVLERIIDPNRYDFRMRPEAKTIVNVSMLILTLSSPDESSVTYEVGFVMYQTWHDPRLKFAIPKSFQGDRETAYINGLDHGDRIWIPDTYFIKHGEFKESTDNFDPLHITLKIFPNGTVLYTTRRNMILTCEGNFKIFPFDSPKCSFGIESRSHERDQIELRWDLQVPIHASESLKTMNAYMKRNETSRCNKRHNWRREFSCLSVLLIFSRDQSFYFSTVFVPGMVLVTSSFISFWLDVNAVPARVMIGVTTMLNFCTTTNSFRSKLPVVSDLNAMNLWDFACMFFIYASMIEFIIVNYIYRKGANRATTGRNGTNRQSISSQSESFSFRNKSTRKKNASTAADSVCNHQESQVKNTNYEAVPVEPKGVMLCEQGSDRTSSSYQDDGMTMSQMKHFVLDWIRRPYLINQENHSSNVQLARSIDHLSKTVFTLLFGLFSFFYFLTFAFIKPAQLDDWIEKEFEAVD